MKRLMVIVGLLLVVALLVPVSCGRAPSEEEFYVMEQASREMEEVEVFKVTAESYPAPAEGGGASYPSYPAPAPEITLEVPPQEISDVGELTERMIVRTGRMWLVVDDVPVALDRIGGLAEDFDGYVVTSKRWQEDERLAGSISIRVPAEHFDTVLRALRGLAVDVTAEDTSSKDVTEEYVDLSAKLHNLEATEEQLLRIMEKAETVEDILNVQRELSRTRDEIERTEGRMQYLERTSSTSLIEIYLEQAKLEVRLYASKARVKEREKVQFYARVSGGFPPYSYEWDLGDGDTSTSEFVTHAYRADGSYTVSLTVTDDQGNTDTEIRHNYIVVLPGWSAGSIASGAWNGMVTLGHVLANIFIWLGIFSPVWIVIGGIVFWWRRRRRRKKAD